MDPSQFPTPPVLTSDQIMAQLDALHPAAKAAALGASKIIGSAPPPAETPPASPNLSPATPGAAPLSETAPPPPGQNMGFGQPTAPMRPIGGPKIPQGLGMPSPESEEDLNEYHRLTAPPLSRNDPMYHSKANTGLPGAQQIGNPIGRTLATIGDVIGSGFFPRAAAAIPGTTAHHNMLVNQQAKVVGEDIAGRNAQARQDLEEAQTGAVPSETDLREAQAEHARAQAEALGNPKAEKVTNELELFMKDPQKFQEYLAAKAKDDPEAKNEIALFQRDPEQFQKYLEAKAAVKPEKEGTDFGQFYKRYLAEHNLEDTASNEAKAKRIWEPPEKPPQMLMVPPQGPAFALRPGVTPPAGSMGATPFASLNAPTMQMKNVAAQAGLVHEQTGAMLQELDKIKDKLGPVLGRWNAFMQGKVGMDDPELAGARADLLMFSSAVALMHARGRLPENLREEFDRTINNPSQSVENLKSVIQHIDTWTVQNMKAMGKNVPETNQAPSGGGQPIVQHSASSGQYRYSTDGGKTWQQGQPPK